MASKTIGIKVEEGLVARLERERATQEAVLGRHLPMSSFLRTLILLALDGPPENRERAVLNAPVSAPPEAVRRWAARVGRDEEARRLHDLERRRRLWERFEAVCQQHRIRPPHFSQAMRELDAAVTPQTCAGWYFQGKLPDGDAGKDLERAVVAFVEHLEAKPKA
jgi:hypothetical protein